MANNYASRLKRDAESFELTLTDETTRLILSFVDEVLKWNKAYNLTSITDYEEAYVKHILDSLSVAPYLTAGKVLDVGTGAGFPGIPLALAKPTLQYTLADSNAKKIRFINHFILMNGLKNVSAVHTRAEQINEPGVYSTIMCRAFSDIAATLKLVQHLLSPGGQFLFMKGPHFEEELSRLPVSAKSEILKIEVPGLDAERYIIRVTL
jgi:16S rRNA (guanine527-N7)-methyltransferase